MLKQNGSIPYDAVLINDELIIAGLSNKDGFLAKFGENETPLSVIESTKDRVIRHVGLFKDNLITVNVRNDGHPIISIYTDGLLIITMIDILKIMKRSSFFADLYQTYIEGHTGDFVVNAFDVFRNKISLVGTTPSGHPYLVQFRNRNLITFRIFDDESLAHLVPTGIKTTGKKTYIIGNRIKSHGVLLVLSCHGLGIYHHPTPAVAYSDMTILDDEVYIGGILATENNRIKGVVVHYNSSLIDPETSIDVISFASNIYCISADDQYIIAAGWVLSPDARKDPFVGVFRPGGFSCKLFKHEDQLDYITKVIRNGDNLIATGWFINDSGEEIMSLVRIPLASLSRSFSDLDMIIAKDDVRLIHRS